MKKGILLVFLFSFLVLNLWGKEWSYKKDCLIHGGKLLLNKKVSLEKKIKNGKLKTIKEERKRLIEELFKYLPPKIKKEFMEKVKELVLKKDKLGEKKFKEKLMELSRKYFSLYRKYLPRKRGLVKDVIKSAKKFADFVKDIAQMTYNFIMAQAKKREEMEKNATPHSGTGVRG